MGFLAFFSSRVDFSRPHSERSFQGASAETPPAWGSGCTAVCQEGVTPSCVVGREEASCLEVRAPGVTSSSGWLCSPEAEAQRGRGKGVHIVTIEVGTRTRASQFVGRAACVPAVPRRSRVQPSVPQPRPVTVPPEGMDLPTLGGIKRAHGRVVLSTVTERFCSRSRGSSRVVEFELGRRCPRKSNKCKGPGVQMSPPFPRKKEELTVAGVG